MIKLPLAVADTLKKDGSRVVWDAVRFARGQTDRVWVVDAWHDMSITFHSEVRLVAPNRHPRWVDAATLKSFHRTKEERI